MFKCLTSACSCPGVRGTACRGVSEVSQSPLPSRSVSRLCSNVAGPPPEPVAAAAAPGVLTNSGSRWRARGEGLLESCRLRQPAWRRAWRISPSLGEESWRSSMKRNNDVKLILINFQVSVCFNLKELSVIDCLLLTDYL